MSTPNNTDNLIIDRSGTNYRIEYKDIADDIENRLGGATGGSFIKTADGGNLQSIVGGGGLEIDGTFDVGPGSIRLYDNGQATYGAGNISHEGSGKITAKGTVSPAGNDI